MIEKLNIGFVRINALFDSLRNYAELNGYFGFKNIQSIRPMVARIQSITTDDLAVFEDDEKLRNEIVNIGDFLSSILTDFGDLENFAQTQTNKEVEDKKNLNNEVRKLRRVILRFGLQITPDLIIVDPTGNYNSPKYNATISILTELKNEFNSSSASIDTMRNIMKDRRFFYSMKCLDAQNRLRSLIVLLEEAKKRYNKRNWILGFLIG